MISSRTLTLATNFVYTIGYHLTYEDKMLSFLPLAHIMEQVLFTISLVYGTQIGYFSGNNNRFLDDIQTLKPTYFCAVPRIYERLYQVIMDIVNKKVLFIK